MKKILGIIVLGLLLSENAYYKTIVVKANDNEVVVTCNTLEKISLQVVSVPIKCSKLGGAKAFDGLTWSNG